ncbi:MAG: cytochrome c oxidase subunit 3 family protein [Acidobacteriota bacterium]|nr:cytochrome c oxidase subunit 3 family protein [Acidobacteriota bacterium]MDQ7087957.1 cytochrome c oxidase subunit 3 family protein [Acidobacteriota bacterium]
MSEAARAPGGVSHEHPRNLAHHFDDPAQQVEAGKLGMWLFLAQEVLFFGGLFAAYAYFRAHDPEMFHYAHKMLNWKLGAFNTLVLICSSLTMAWGVRLAQLGKRRGLVWMLILTLVFATVFLGVKYVEYKEKFEHQLLWGRSYNPDPHVLEEHGIPEEVAVASLPSGPAADAPVAPASDAAPVAGDAGAGQPEPVEVIPRPPQNLHIFFGIYFALTGLHGLHVLIGMGVIGWVLMRAARGDFGPDYFTPVDMVGLYWHLVDLIWIFLFPLLYLIS